VIAKKWDFRPALAVVGLCVFLGLLWEGVKWAFEVNDIKLPHLRVIAEGMVNESRREGPPMYAVLLEAALYTAKGALTGFAAGAALGFVLGVIFAHSPLLERALVPYMVASQTVPILAIAPMVVIWLRNPTLSVAVIAAYLTFFPVVINTLRGLHSPDPRAVELMRSFAASKWETLWKLRFPTALPAIFTALKIAATASVIGAIVGELPSGSQDGLGRAILNYNQYYATGPERLWNTIIVTAAVGILFFVAVTLAERLALRNIVRSE
jgi:NitT/TauT family transport system permease protein